MLEGTTQILGASLFGLTFQCARCHDHKFEPITQKDYYALYAILQPAYDIDHWVKPQQRIVEAPLPGELAAWEAEGKRLDEEIASRKAAVSEWVRQNRPRGDIIFADDFDGDEPLAARWSAQAPGDAAPAGSPAVAVDSASAPGAVIAEGSLRIIESGAAGDRALSTVRSFDWTPDETGDWVQVTFELVDIRIPPDGHPAERIAYFLALHDFGDNGPDSGGNLLIDGNPGGGASVHVDYPGQDAKALGKIGQSGYRAGGNFGVRITNKGEGQFQLEHLVDWVPEESAITLEAGDLPDGGFGFEYCCNRSFIVDHVVVESGHGSSEASRAFAAALAGRRKPLDDLVKTRASHQGRKPGRIAWVSDVSPDVTGHVLKRGLYNQPDEPVEPSPPAVLCDPDNPYEVEAPIEGGSLSGRRLAFARWLTHPGSRPAALLARVTVNRIWQDHFGIGLTPTTENLGYSGTLPTHPDLLEFLAAELVRNGWRLKPVHRLILTSTAYRQSSAPT